MSSELSGVENDQNVLKVMRSVLYPDADEATVQLVLAYCRATAIDPLLKPYHITYVNYEYEPGKWVKRAQILPSITLYRIKAQRSGDYLGHSAPVFGPNIKENIGGVAVAYPEWCSMVFYRQLKNKIAEFNVIEYWKENYGTAKKSDAPNKMWSKRQHGQLAKCTEAQGLRQIYPELLGSMPTIEEMEGKDFYGAIEDKSNKKPLLKHTERVINPISESTLKDLITICASCDEYGDRMNKYLEKKGLATISELSEQAGQRVLAKMLEDEKAWDLLMVKEEEAQ